MAAPWMTASVIPQVVRKIKKPAMTDAALPAIGVGRNSTRNGITPMAMAVIMARMIGIHSFMVSPIPRPVETILRSALHQHGGLVIFLEIEIVENFRYMSLLDHFLRGYGNPGGVLQGLVSKALQVVISAGFVGSK